MANQILTTLRAPLLPSLGTAVTHSRHVSTVGFIGLGNMGGHMAINLIKKGYSLVVYDKEHQHMKNAKEAGATVASNPKEIAQQATQIITMLPSTPHVQEVYLGDNGIFETVQKGSLLLDCSTIDPAMSRNIAHLSTNHDAQYMDAPVSGGVNAARDGTLTFMVGGPSNMFESAKTLLSNIGKNVVHCGDSGNGQAAKICNNMLLAISMIGVSETMNLGMNLGLDPKVLAGILNTSTGRCWSTDTYNPVPGVLPGVPSSNNYEGGFGTALMAKDLGLAQNAATTNKCATPLGSLAHQVYRLMCNQGYSGKDFSSAYMFLRNSESS